MTTTKINVPTKDEKEKHSAKLAQQVAEYLAKGGTITRCPDRAFTKTEGPKKRFDGGRNDSLTDPTNRDVGAYRPTIKET
mgnify:CR=1 FL=1